MYHMHGKFQTAQGMRLSYENLLAIHEAMHLDGYMCPPHSHKKGEVAKVKLKYGENYLQELADRARETHA